MASGSLTDSLRETLGLFEERDAPRTTTEVAESLELGRRSTYDRLRRLVDYGELATKKVGASARVWWRPRPTPSEESPGRAQALGPDSFSVVESVLDDAEVGVFVLDENFEVAWVTDTTEKYFGLSREEALGRDKRALVDEHISTIVADAESFSDVVLATYDDNTYTELFECHVTAGDGRDERWLEHYSKPIESGPYAGGRIEFYEDITHRKRREEAHHRDREQFESLADAVDEYASYTLDADGHVETWNPGAARITGYDTEDVVGEHVSVFYTDEDREADAPETDLAVAAEEGTAQRTGWRVREDGSRFWANVTTTAIYDSENRLQGYAKVTRDMTDRREREHSVRLERDLLEKILETSPVGVVVLDAKGMVVRANDRAETLLDLTASQMFGRSYYEPDWNIWNEHGESISFDEHPVTRVLETGEPVHGFRHGITFPDGTERWFSSNSAPIFDESGDIERVVVALEDISQVQEQARQLEQRRDELESELEEMFDRVSDGFYGLDEHFRFTYVNDRAETLLDIDESDVVGRDIREVLPLTAGFDEVLHEASEGDEPVSFEDYYEPLDAWFENVFYPSETGLSVYFRDITERKARERELERYETLFETIDDGVYAVDGDSRFVMVNDSFCELTGYDRDELVGAPTSTILADDTAPAPDSPPTDLGDPDITRVEFDVRTKSDDVVPCESRLASCPIGDTAGRCGVVRDVSDHLEQELTLRRRVHQQEAVTELGQRALEDRDVDGLMAEAARVLAETLAVDYCKVLDMDADAGELLLRQGVGWDDGLVGNTTVSAVEDDSQAAYTLEANRPVVVEDLAGDSRFSGPDLLTSHDVRSGISVIVGPPDDPWGILGVHDTSVTEFSEHDVNFVQSVANILATAITRHRDERALVRQREQLRALNSLNEVVREITDAVIDQSTRDEIEQTVCERLAATDSYMFAWVGDVDVNSQMVHVRTEAGVDGYLDDVRISVDPDDERSQGPTGRAIRTGEIQTVQDTHADSRHDPWREEVEAYGIRSSAAVPIVHDDTVYGSLNVYAPRPNAFEGQERAMLGQLGEVVGHAIAATERKRALMSDEVVELEFRTRGLFDTLGVGDTGTGLITVDQAIPIEDEKFLLYGRASEDAVESVKAMVETRPHWTDVTFRTETGDTKFELELSDSPLLSRLASVGGAIEQVVFEDGDYHMRLHVSPRVEVRKMTDAVQEAFPSATLLKRRQITRRDDTVDRVERVLRTSLTDRQRAALEAAFHAGYFEWPREATGEDVADSLGVSPPTFHQHLRKAQHKVLESLLTT